MAISCARPDARTNESGDVNARDEQDDAYGNEQDLAGSAEIAEIARPQRCENGRRDLVSLFGPPRRAPGECAGDQPKPVLWLRDV